MNNRWKQSNTSSLTDLSCGRLAHGHRSGGVSRGLFPGAEDFLCGGHRSSGVCDAVRVVVVFAIVFVVVVDKFQ